MTIKKAELHVHLEGTIAPDLAKRLAKRNKLLVPEGLIAPDEQSYLSDDFLHFLKVYDSVAAFIKTPRDYYDVCFEYLRDRAKADAIYVEMMYSPDHAEQSSGIPSIEHLQALQQAIDDAESQFDIVGRIIITAVRHFGEKAAIRVAEQGVLDKLPCVTGFGLGGDEIHFPPKLFKEAYHIAAEGGLACTVHAGEFAGPQGMEEAMDNLPIQRIGHGVRGIESLQTLERVKELGIALEVCPSSNIKLGLYKNMATHPFPKLLEAGIKVSISSDDPPFMSTSLEQEYERVQQAYAYSDEQMNAISAMALRCAFVDEKTRDSLLARVE